MTAKLVKTEAVVEGRTEVRWTLVEDDDTPEFEEGSATHPIGDPTPRITARARTTGTARFTVDVGLPGLLEAAVLRSPARERQGDVARPRRRAAPCPACAACSAPATDPATTTRRSATPRTSPAPRSPPSPPTPPDAAEAALAALAPTYEVLGFVSDIDEAFERQDFLVDPTEHERGDLDAALAAADVKVEATYIAPAQLHNSMEPHCRRRRLARGRAHGLELDPGHLRRARDRGRGVRARSRARPRRSASSWAAGSARSTASGRRGSSRPSSRAAPAGRCGSCTPAARRTWPPATARRLRRSTRSGRRATGASRRSRHRP